MKIKSLNHEEFFKDFRFDIGDTVISLETKHLGAIGKVVNRFMTESKTMVFKVVYHGSVEVKTETEDSIQLYAQKCDISKLSVIEDIEGEHYNKKNFK